jgi:sugar O-acyltransferase (sialic acid O-acetyltransferase NeuD family)
MNKPKLILIGGGGHCKSCIDIIEQENKYEIAGILDVKEKIGEKISNYAFIGTDEDLEELSKKNNFFLITLGQIKSAEKRITLFNKLISLNANIPNVISPLAYVSKHSLIGKGTIIMHHAIVNAGAKVGDNCIINTKALIEHDALIEDHCHISTGAIINGGVKVGSGTFYGSGAVTREYTTIPANSFIKANSIAK